MANELLKLESEYFESHRKEFLEIAMGKFVLVKGQKSFGFFDDPQAAYQNGVDQFGIEEAFLIKQVVPEEVPDEIPAHFLGLMYASR
jgi:hypothetical protein